MPFKPPVTRWRASVTAWRTIVALAICVLAASVWFAGRIQLGATERSNREAQAGQQMMSVMLDNVASLRSYLLSGNASNAPSLTPKQFAAAASQAQASSRGDAQAERLLERQIGLAAAWSRDARITMAAAAVRTPQSDAASLSARTDSVLDEFRAANAEYLALISSQGNARQRAASWASAGLVLAISTAFGVAGYLLITRPRRREAEREAAEREYERTQFGFTTAMLAKREIRDAQLLIKHHLERTILGTTVAVLERDGTAQMLRLATPLPERSPVARALEEGQGACLASALGAPQHRSRGETTTPACRVCGYLAENVACEPLIAGGEIIGSVLVEHRRPLAAIERRRLTESIAQAAPVVANLRNLALAERRAATDSLTGLPNRRAVQESLRRMVANASRSETDLSLIVVDLDRFKQINDAHGHERGDQALLAVGRALSANVRESDLVGRFGGEEFVVLAPATPSDGAEQLAETLREAVRATSVPGLDEPITASFGVASFPAHAAQDDELLRLADRALYRAKDLGRDRVEVAHREEGGASARPALA
jgi:diguanylate cyclase (GGDEF)-like protein